MPAKKKKVVLKNGEYVFTRGHNDIEHWQEVEILEDGSYDLHCARGFYTTTNWDGLTDNITVLRRLTKKQYEELDPFEKTHRLFFKNGLEADDTYNDCLLAPDGRLIACGFAQHEKVAEELYNSIVRDLRKDGFIRIGSGRYYISKKPTEIQRDIILKWGWEYKYDRHYPEYLPLSYYYEEIEK